MSDCVWRNFRFFESEPFPPTSALAGLNVVCSCLTPTAVVVGDYEGQVFFVDRHAPSDVLCSFQAYAGAVTHAKYAALRNTLITIGDDDALNTAILRVWDMDQLMGLYRGLLDKHADAASLSASSASPITTTTTTATTPTALRWRPPCQEHRLRNASKSSSTTDAEDLLLVPIFLQESQQLQYTFQSSASPSPSPSSSPLNASLTATTSRRGVNNESNSNKSIAVVSCGSIRSAVVSFDVASDLSCAAVGLVSRDCVVLKGDLTSKRSVRAHMIRSGIAKGALTFVGLPSPLHTTLLGGDQRKGNAAPNDSHSGAAEKNNGVFSFHDGGREGGQQVRSGGRTGSSPLPLGSTTTAAPTRNVQLLYTVHEDAVTCWALRENGNWSEYLCPTFGGAPLFGTALAPRGELLLLGKQSAAYASGSRVLRLGPPLHTAGDEPAVETPYDPTVKASVQTIDIDRTPGRCFLSTYRHYLVLTVQQEGRPGQFHLQCYDLSYKIRGLSRPQESYVNCATVLADDAELLVLFQDPAVRSKQLVLRGVWLREVNTQTKLELLLGKECYGIAQQLVQTMEGADPALQMLIRKKYGDYLYDKGKVSDAMAQYVATIGYLESSYVIRRYMGSAHMDELIRYLEELHHQRHSGFANVAHTTLLLKCYRKRNDAARLNAFIHRDDVRFDPQNAVAVCREGGYAKAALYVADRYAQVYDCARIRLYDLHEPLAMLTYLRTLGVDEVESICAQLGKDLLALAPRTTTELLIELCVYWKGPGRRLVDTTAASGSGSGGGGIAAVIGTSTSTDSPFEAAFSSGGDFLGGSPRHTHHANAAAFLHIFVDAPACLMNFLRAVVESGVLEEDDERGRDGTGRMRERVEKASPSAVNPHAVLYNTLLELYVTRNLKNTLRLVPVAAPSLHNDVKDVGRASFSTTGMKDDSVNATSNAAAENFPVEPYERRLEQARAFLEAYKGRYDHYLALSLAHQHHFQDGILYLLRTLDLSEEILGYYSAKLNDPQTTQEERQEATDKIFQACQGRPSGDSRTTAMWMTLLSQLVRTPQTEWQDIVKVLDYIETHDALPPVVVLEVLSSNPQSTLQLRTVRDYCERCLRKQNKQVQDVLTNTAQRLTEMERIKSEVTALQTSAVVFQTTTCAHCHQVLDAPTVYFMCKHAFHHRCLYTPTECNVCAAVHRRQLDGIREAQQRDLQRQNPSAFTAQYFHDLKAGVGGSRRPDGDNANEAAANTAHNNISSGLPLDGFQVVTDYIARGVLGAPPLYKDAGLFGVEAGVPLRFGGDARRDAEERLNAEDLYMW